MQNSVQPKSPEEAIFRLRRQLTSQPTTAAGIMTTRRVAWIPEGPSGDQELLALVFADDPSLRCWYGYAGRHPGRRGYVALLVDSHVFIDGKDASLVMQRFHFWIAQLGKFTPATIQQPDDAYAETVTWQGALDSLTEIVRRFDIRLRTGLPDHHADDRPIEMRIHDLFPVLSDPTVELGEAGLAPGVKEFYAGMRNASTNL